MGTFNKISGGGGPPPSDGSLFGGGAALARVSTSKEIHILSLTFDSFFMSNVSGSSDFARLFPFLLV